MAVDGSNLPAGSSPASVLQAVPLPQTPASTSVAGRSGFSSFTLPANVNYALGLGINADMPGVGRVVWNFPAPFASPPATDGFA